MEVPHGSVRNTEAMPSSGFLPVGRLESDSARLQSLGKRLEVPHLEPDVIDDAALGRECGGRIGLRQALQGEVHPGHIDRLPVGASPRRGEQLCGIPLLGFGGIGQTVVEMAEIGRGGPPMVTGERYRQGRVFGQLHSELLWPIDGGLSDAGRAARSGGVDLRAKGAQPGGQRIEIRHEQTYVVHHRPIHLTSRCLLSKYDKESCPPHRFGLTDPDRRRPEVRPELLVGCHVAHVHVNVAHRDAAFVDRLQLRVGRTQED